MSETESTLHPHKTPNRWRAQFLDGAAVLVAGFGKVACRYLGPQMEPNPSEFEAECDQCGGTGTDEYLDEVHDGNCLECDGAGKVLAVDEEPGESETGRAIVRMVGDDARHVVDYEDMTLVDEDDVCSCGQLGCWSNNNTMGGES